MRLWVCDSKTCNNIIVECVLIKYTLCVTANSQNITMASYEYFC